jgi:hypothetical protein
MIPETYQFIVQGCKNPVLVALQALQKMTDMEIDEDSFKRVALLVGEVEAEGFPVEDVSDVRKLCNLGHFYIKQTDGKLVASLE